MDAKPCGCTTATCFCCTGPEPLTPAVIWNRPGLPALRDRALLALLALQGLRTVEITRANVEDLYSGEPVVLRVRGKTRDRLLPLRADLAAVLQTYLDARGPVDRDAAGIPLLTAVGNRAGGQRLSRRHHSRGQLLGR